MKLSGLKVLDLSSFLPGPYLTLALADHGADVVKIEAPGGDHGRHIGLRDGDQTVFFKNLNRGKRSIVLNLKSFEDRERFLTLADSADVVVESSRPGVAVRLGIDYDTLAARNPGLVYCAISAFGQSGPRADRAAHDLALEALTGVVSTNLGADGKPAIPAIPVSDYLSGLQGLSGVLMALLRRQVTGKGDYIDISMQESMLAATVNVLGPTMAEQRQPDPTVERTTGGSAFYRIYDTSDGRQIVLAGQEPKFVVSLLTAIGRPDLVPLCVEPGPHQLDVVAVLQARFGGMTAKEIEQFLDGLDVCWGLVKTFPEALVDPQIVARDFVVRDAEGRTHLASPIRFRHEPACPSFDVPALDRDRTEILYSAPEH